MQNDGGEKPYENVIYPAFISSFFLHDDENKSGNILSLKIQVALWMH